MSDPWLGRRLGDQQRYRLDRRLGGGAVGDVFLAMDVRMGRRVAIKVLKGALAKSKELLARFEREVALSVALESEHIVQVVDYGVASGGYPFYVMEYLQGQTLSYLLAKAGRLSVERAITIANQICAGLKVAHEGVTLWKNEATISEHVKVIHRDLKPANIFLVNTALGDLVKILDFGIAKKLHTAEQAEQTNLTQAFLGTFRYAAPEQLKNAWNIDERADIYSLGIILYQMLSRTDPFGIEAKPSSQVELSWAMAHAAIEPTPLRQQPGCDQLPAELEAVIMRCLRKPAAERFATVVQLSQALNAILQASRVASVSSGAAHLDDLDPTVPHGLVGQEPTVSRPIAQQPLNTDANFMTQAPSHLEPEPIDSTIVQMAASGSVNPVGQPIVQQSTASPSPNSPDGTIAQIPPAAHSKPPTPPDSTIVQSSPLPPAKSSETIIQTPKSPGSPAGATMMQRPATPRPNHPDATIAQVPPANAANRPDATIVQPPKMASNRDATLVQGRSPQPANPNIPYGQAPAQMPANAPVPPPMQGREALTPPQNVMKSGDPRRTSPTSEQESLMSQGMGWLKNNYGDRFMAQASAEARQASRRLASNLLLPLGVGFAFGLSVITGAYFFLRSQVHRPTSPPRKPLSMIHERSWSSDFIFNAQVEKDSTDPTDI